MNKNSHIKAKNNNRGPSKDRGRNKPGFQQIPDVRQFETQTSTHRIRHTQHTNTYAPTRR